MSKVFVIVVTYNGIQWYDRCFFSLRTSALPVQTIVIDNASSDDTIGYIQKKYPEVNLINSKTNIGFGQANNKGMRYALEHEADYVFLLNQDAWIEQNTIAALINIHKRNPGFGILSPLHLNAKKTAIEKGLMHYIADYKITSSDLINDLYFNRTGDVYETQYVNAAAWLLPRQTLETVGGFDPIFFHYGEDDNYMQRVHYHGMKIGICPKVRIIHDTERRIIKQEHIDNTHKKCLLVELTDININNNINIFYRNNLNKIILKSLKGNWNKSKALINDFIYIIRMDTKIKRSRSINTCKNTNWL